MESWKRGREMEVVPLSNVRRTEGPERELGVRGLQAHGHAVERGRAWHALFKMRGQRGSPCFRQLAVQE